MDLYTSWLSKSCRDLNFCRALRLSDLPGSTCCVEVQLAGVVAVLQCGKGMLQAV